MEAPGCEVETREIMKVSVERKSSRPCFQKQENYFHEGCLGT